MPSILRRLLPPGPSATAAEIVQGLGLHTPPAESAPGLRTPAERALDTPAAAGPARPRVLLNMVSTADGRATIGGRSGAIGNQADRELFHALRTVVDAVIVGAGTARAEHYRRLVRAPQARALRREHGLAEEPLACIVSGRLGLRAEDIPLLADPQARVAIVTSSQASLSGAAQIEAQVEYVRATREGRLDLPAALAELHERLQVRTVLCEGGPHLNAQLLKAGVVDELFLSLAPKLAGGDAEGESLRILAGTEFDPPVELELVGALESESHLFLRYWLRGGSAVKERPR